MVSGVFSRCVNKKEDVKSDNGSSISSENKEVKKIKIYKKNLKRCMKELGLPASAFEFREEETIKTDMERYEEAIKNGQWREHELFNIY